MLVLSRQRDEEIYIGDQSTRFVQLSPLDIQKLKHCTDPGLLDLAERLLDERNHGPVPITIVDIRGDKVRLGVQAPKDVSVHRAEVYRAIRAANRAAASVAGTEAAQLERAAKGKGAA